MLTGTILDKTSAIQSGMCQQMVYNNTSVLCICIWKCYNVNCNTIW